MKSMNCAGVRRATVGVCLCSAGVRCGWRWNAALSTRAKKTIAGKLGCSVDLLCFWMCQAQRDVCERSGQNSTEMARVKELEREVVIDLHRFRSGEVLLSGGLLFESHGGFTAKG